MRYISRYGPFKATHTHDPDPDICNGNITDLPIWDTGIVRIGLNCLDERLQSPGVSC